MTQNQTKNHHQENQSFGKRLAHTGGFNYYVFYILYFVFYVDFYKEFALDQKILYHHHIRYIHS